MQAAPASLPSPVLRRVSSTRRRKSSTPHPKRGSKGSDVRLGESTQKRFQPRSPEFDSQLIHDTVFANVEAPGLVSPTNAAVSLKSVPPSPVGKRKQSLTSDNTSNSAPHVPAEKIEKPVSSDNATGSPRLKPKRPKRKVAYPKATQISRKTKPICRKCVWNCEPFVSDSLPPLTPMSQVWRIARLCFHCSCCLGRNFCTVLVAPFEIMGLRRAQGSRIFSHIVCRRSCCDVQASRARTTLRRLGDSSWSADAA